MGYRTTTKFYSIVFANGATVSAPFMIEPGERILGISFPTMTGTNFTLEVSPDRGTTFVTWTGPTVAKGASQFVAFTTDANFRGTQSLGLVRLKSDGTEGAERTVTVAVGAF